MQEALGKLVHAALCGWFGLDWRDTFDIGMTDDGRWIALIGGEYKDGGDATWHYLT